MKTAGDEVLRRKSEFAAIYDRGEAIRSPNIVLIYLRTAEEDFKGAVVASRKVGSAVRRNRAKRLLREAHRQLRPHARLNGVRAALIARSGAAAANGRCVLQELKGLYRQAGFIEGALGPSSSYRNGI